MSENGMGTCNPAMTGKYEVKSSPHAVAFDGSDYRRRVTGDKVHERLPHDGEFISIRTRESGNLVEVSANGEKLPVACDDQWLRIATEIFDRLSQSECAFACKAVSAIL